MTNSWNLPRKHTPGCYRTFLLLRKNKLNGKPFSSTLTPGCSWLTIGPNGEPQCMSTLWPLTCPRLDGTNLAPESSLSLSSGTGNDKGNEDSGDEIETARVHRWNTPHALWTLWSPERGRKHHEQWSVWAVWQTMPFPQRTTRWLHSHKRRLLQQHPPPSLFSFLLSCFNTFITVLHTLRMVNLMVNLTEGGQVNTHSMSDAENMGYAMVSKRRREGLRDVKTRQDNLYWLYTKDSVHILKLQSVIYLMKKKIVFVNKVQSLVAKVTARFSS